MFRSRERLATILADFLSINVTYLLFYTVSVHMGRLMRAEESVVMLPMFAIYGYWIVFFSFFGLYRPWYEQSRIDEVLIVFRATIYGVLVLLLLMFLIDPAAQILAHSRFFIVGYWLLLVAFVTVSRLALRSAQRRLLLAGIGLKNTVIVGWSDKAFELYTMIKKYPALGYKVVGFVKTATKKASAAHGKSDIHRDVQVLGSVRELSDIIIKKQIRTVLIGIDSTEHEELLEIIRRCDNFNVGIRIVPDLYDIVSGQVKINSIYGLPLMEVHPQLLRPWEEFAKRALDICTSFAVLVVMFPLWLLIAITVKMNSYGPILYKQVRVGKDGKHFRMLKFRSMRSDAEKQSGPVWAGKNDPRVTKVGRLLRKTHLDELPQFWNVFAGDMSLVGPRPERPFFVDRLSKEIPLYRHRLRVKPGITGWAQVKHKYDENIDDVRTKIKYDLFYIENISWRLDLKILFNTVYVMVAGKGHA